MASHKTHGTTFSTSLSFILTLTDFTALNQTQSLRQTKKIFMFGWKHAILLHNSHPPWLTPSLFCHRSVHLGVFFVFLQLSFLPFTYFPNRIVDTMQKFEVQSEWWKSKCKRLSDELSRQGSGREAGPCATCLNKNRANRNALLSDYQRGGPAPALFPDSLDECLHCSSVVMNVLHCWFVWASRLSQGCNRYSGIDLLRLCRFRRRVHRCVRSPRKQRKSA